MMYRETPVVVLGAAGFIGRWVARLLGAQGARLTLVVRDREAAEDVFRAYGIRGDIVVADLSTPASIVPVLRERKPAIVFNMAGYGVPRFQTDERLLHSINTELLDALCDAAAALGSAGWRGRQIVHVGSAAEYGSIAGDLREDSVPNPTTPYGITKLAGARILAARSEAEGIRSVTARLFTIYGPGEHDGRLLPSLLKAAATGNGLELTAGNQKRDFTYVEDAAEGLLRLGESEGRPGEIVNVATGNLTSVREFVTIAAEVLSIPPNKLRFGSLPMRPEEMEHLPVNTERLTHLLGWLPPTSIAAGIWKTLEWTTSTSCLSTQQHL